MADKVKIEIEAKAAGDGFVEAERGLAKVGQAADKDVDSLKRVQAEMATATAAQKERATSSGSGDKNNFASELARDIPGANNALSALTGTLGTAAIAAGSTMAAFEAARRSIDAFAGAQLEVAKLDAALSTSGQFTDEYREKLQLLADQLQETTAISNDEWLGVLTTLTKFGADSSNIDQYSEAVKNLAGFLGGDLQTASFLFGKAMQGSTEMLGRYGIQVDKSKSQTEQLNDIMAQVAARGGGQLEAMAGTLSGSWKGLGLSTDDLFKSFGRIISETGVLQAVMTGLAADLQAANEMFFGTIKALDGTTNKIVLQSQTAEEAARSIAEYNKVLAETKGQSDAIVTSLAEQTKGIDDQATSVREITRAQKDLALAQVETDASLSKEDKVKARADVEKRFAAAELNASIATASDKIKAREDAIAKLEDLAAQNRQRLDEQRAKTAAAKKNEAEAQASADEINGIRKNLQEQQKALTAAKRALAEEQNTDRAAGPNPEVTAEAELNIRNIERTIAALETQKQKIGEVNEEAKKFAQIEAANLAAAEAAFPDDAKANADAQARLAQENELEKAKAKTKQEVAAIDAETAKTKAAADAKSAADAAATAAATNAAKQEELAIETQLNEARALGNQKEVEKLEWLKEYNRIRRQTDSSGESLFSEEEARLSANASTAATHPQTDAYAKPGTKSPGTTAPGELATGSNYRRGLTQSDSSFEMAQADQSGGSLLDAYNATKNLAVGSQNGKSILPDDPKSSSPASSGDNPAATAAKDLADQLKKSQEEIAKNLTEATKSTDNAKVIKSLTGFFNAIKAAQERLQQQIDALAQKI